MQHSSPAVNEFPDTAELCGRFAIWVTQKHKSPHNQGHIVCQNSLIPPSADRPYGKRSESPETRLDTPLPW